MGRIKEALQAIDRSLVGFSETVRELSDCPPDCDLETWLPIIAASHRRECDAGHPGGKWAERIADQESKIAVMEDEFTALHIAVATLRAALEPFAGRVDREMREDLVGNDSVTVRVDELRAAAEAMAATSGEEPMMVGDCCPSCGVYGIAGRRTCSCEEEPAKLEWVEAMGTMGVPSWRAKKNGVVDWVLIPMPYGDGNSDGWVRVGWKEVNGDNTIFYSLASAQAAVQAKHDRLVAEAAEGTDG